MTGNLGRRGGAFCFDIGQFTSYDNYEPFRQRAGRLPSSNGDRRHQGDSV